MGTHLEADHVARFRRGALAPADVAAISAHLAECAECATLALDSIDERSLRAIDGGLMHSSAGHPNLETDLFRFVDGTLPADERDRVEAHLGLCERCAAEVADLQATAASLVPVRRAPRRRRTLFLAAAAAAVVAAIGGSFLRPRDPGSPMTVPRAQIDAPAETAVTTTAAVPSPARSRPEWEALVAEALRSGQVPIPRALRGVRTGPERMRGTDVARKDAVSPAGVIVASDRPLFAWPAPRGAESEVPESEVPESEVMVYAGENEVATSGPIRGHYWTPPKPLPRGVPLTWQVEIRSEGKRTVIPSPPDPPSLFRIATEAQLREIEEARRLHPHDDLLIGLLYARAGLSSDALAALRRHAAAHPEARPLVQSIERWH
jgi:anti-sigma factor RsiW